MTLLLHCGAESASHEDLASIPLPKETKSYKPVAHQGLANMLKDMAAHLLPEFELRSTQFGLARDGGQMFGIHTFKNGNSALGLSIGFRNSYDRSLSVGIALGASVFVCDNLMLTGDLTVLRKHTTNVLTDINALALSAMYRSRTAFDQISQDSVTMQGVPVSDDDAYRMLGLVYGHGIITPRQIPVVKSEWETPSHDAFAPRNMWSFYNAVTEALKSSPPQSILERHLAIHKQIMNPLRLRGGGN